jgi:hypothetical protein
MTKPIRKPSKKSFNDKLMRHMKDTGVEDLFKIHWGRDSLGAYVEVEVILSHDHSTRFDATPFYEDYCQGYDEFYRCLLYHLMLKVCDYHAPGAAQFMDEYPDDDAPVMSSCRKLEVSHGC